MVISIVWFHFMKEIIWLLCMLIKNKQKQFFIPIIFILVTGKNSSLYF